MLCSSKSKNWWKCQKPLKNKIWKFLVGFASPRPSIALILPGARGPWLLAPISNYGLALSFYDAVTLLLLLFLCSQADKVDMYWNNKGNYVLLLTSTETDKTGATYYGKQSLHFLSTKGDTAIVLLSESNFRIISPWNLEYFDW